MASESAAAVVRFRREWTWKREYWWHVPIGVQLVALLVFSTWQASRFALTHDFALYWQAVYLIAHGHLNPWASMDGFHFLDNHFELIMWPTGLLYWLWPRPSLLLYIQDGALVGANYLAWVWIRSIAHQVPRLTPQIRALGLALLVLNPWTYWTAATDFHSESLIALTLTGTALAIWRRDGRRLVAWAGLTLACGDVAAVGLFALGITALWRRQWRTAAGLGTTALVWLEFITQVHGNRGSILSAIYGYLDPHAASRAFSMVTVMTLLVRHPGIALAMVGAHWQNLLGNAGPGGLLGVFSGWAFPLYAATVVVSNLSSGYLFGVPGFQNVPVYPLVAVGTISVIPFVLRFLKLRLTQAVMALVLANALGWAIVWLPTIPRHWVRVPAATAANLTTELHAIPASAEVIVNQSIMGRFAGRPWEYQTSLVGALPVHTDPFYVVIAPYAGVHNISVQAEVSIVAQLTHLPNAKLLWFGAHTYVWAVYQHVGTTFALNAGQMTNLPAWAFASQTGTPVVGSAPKNWYVAGLGQNGNVLDQAYWREAPGRLHASVTYSSMGPLWLQVWNATTGKLITQRYVPTSDGHKATATFPIWFAPSMAAPPQVFAGFGLWRIHPAEGHGRNELEIRVNAQAASMTNVYAVGLSKGE